MFKGKFYPKAVQMNTDNARASVTNSMSSDWSGKRKFILAHLPFTHIPFRTHIANDLPSFLFSGYKQAPNCKIR